MTSWRDTSSQDAQNDLDGLLSAALDLAHHLVSERGEFYPVGLAVPALSDEVEIVAADAGVGDHPETADVIVACRRLLFDRRSQLRAAAIVVPVVLATGQGDDGVRVELEHVEGVALTVVAPYTRTGNAVSYGQLSASAGTRYLWPV